MANKEFETGPVEGLQVPIAMRDPRFLKLSSTEKVTLANWYGTPAYEVWVKLSQGEIEKLETAHFQNWKDREAFERTGLLAVSARIFFERIMSECTRQMEEFSGEVVFLKQKKDLLNTSLEDQVKQEFRPE